MERVRLYATFKTDLDFDVYQTLRKEVEPLLLELILNYSFSEEEERDLLREIAKNLLKTMLFLFKNLIIKIKYLKQRRNHMGFLITLKTPALTQLLQMLLIYTM